MSTIRWETAWNLEMGWPNCLRLRAWAMQRSSWRRIVPRVPARIAPRSHSRAALKIAGAAAFAVEQGVGGQFAVLEGKLGHRGGAHAELGDLADDAEAGGVAAG